MQYLKGRVSTFVAEVIQPTYHSRAMIRAELHNRGICHAILWHDSKAEKNAFAQYVAQMGGACTPVTGELNLNPNHWGRSIAVANGIVNNNLVKIAFTKSAARDNFSEVEIFKTTDLQNAENVFARISSGEVKVHVVYFHVNTETGKLYVFSGVAVPKANATTDGKFRIAALTPASEWVEVTTWEQISGLFPR